MPHGVGEELRFELGEQIYQFGLRLFERLQMAALPRPSDEQIGADESNGIVHGLMHGFELARLLRVKLLEMGFVQHKPMTEVAKSVRHGCKRVFARRCTQHSAAQHTA